MRAAKRRVAGSRILLGSLLASSTGGVVGLTCGCGDQVDAPVIAGLCDPRSSSSDNCPERYSCCSDDPATVGGSIDGQPLFSATNNGNGRSGMCVDEDLSGRDSSQPGCPTPCNPTWSGERIRDVCDGGQCCQTVELHPHDCVFDPFEGRWRPADGRDAEEALAGGDRWRPTSKSTHQDPDFAMCEAFARDSRESDVFRDCVRQLSTANQRGYCMELAGGARCPLEDESYIDPCEVMN